MFAKTGTKGDEEEGGGDETMLGGIGSLSLCVCVIDSGLFLCLRIKRIKGMMMESC